VIRRTVPLNGGEGGVGKADIAAKSVTANGPQIEIRADVAASAPDQREHTAMPRRNSVIKRLLFLGRGWDEWDSKPLPELQAQQAPKPKSGRRFATTLSFSALFFAGLALSAGAGNTMRSLLDGTSGDATTSSTAQTTLTAAEVTPAQPVHAVVHVSAHQTGARAVAARVSQGAQLHAVARASGVRSAVRTAARAVHVRQTGGRSVARTVGSTRPQAKKPARTRTARPGRPEKSQPLDSEGTLPGATVWLYQAAPDPTPPAARLRMRFARELVAQSRAAHVDWALVLAVLRAGGHDGRSPASIAQVHSLSLRLAGLGGRANGWQAALSYSTKTSFADRVVALRHYYRAVGMPSLVYGLLSQKRDLEDRVLHDSRISIYPGGRSDVANHRVDVRVLAVMLYLADTYHSVTASCLISGHRLYARPGVVSAHIYGRAVDIASLDGVSIYGHQQPGGITEQAVRALLLLPPEMMPSQIISLLGLGGPSFPLANHYDHIHVGY
jgi:hypothetical protein